MSTYHKIRHLEELAAEEPDFPQYKIILDRLDFLLHDLREMRISKIISNYLISSDLPQSEENLTKQEQRFVNTFCGLLKSLREINTEKAPISESSKTKEFFSSVPSITTSPSPPIENSNDEELIVLRFLSSVDAFVGADGLNYGPFSIGDVAVVPSQNAYKVLIPRAVAEEIEAASNLLK
ncbi:MAG: hypothetical protein ACFFDT_03020 [Candidatus Hodarchaeota archaeon]